MHPDLAGIILMIVTAVMFAFAAPAEPSRVVVVDLADVQYLTCPEMQAAWAALKMDAEAAWAEYLEATADALAAYDTAADKKIAGPIYLALEVPHREVYFAKLAAADAVYDATRTLLFAARKRKEK